MILQKIFVCRQQLLMIASWLRHGQKLDVFISGIWRPHSATLTILSHQLRRNQHCLHSPATSQRVTLSTGAQLIKVYYMLAS